MKAGFPFDVSRPWGSFRQFTQNEPSTVKLVSVSAGEMLSLQSHNDREEFIRVIAGSCSISLDGVSDGLGVGDERVIPSQTKHRISAGAEGLVLLEISFGRFDEDDIVRYEDKYGRVSKI